MWIVPYKTTYHTRSPHHRHEEEEKAHAFYAAWKGKCASEKTAKLFEILENEEARHKRKLENLYDEEILTWD